MTAGSTPYRVPRPQKEQSTNPCDYKVIIVVFGSRGYRNKKEFHEELMSYLDHFPDQPILFVSGAAPSGADDLIIRWCRRFHYPCLLVPADWDKYKKAAGFIRNTEMAKLATNGLGFWDEESPDTKQMIGELLYYEISHRVVKIEPIPKPDKKTADSYDAVRDVVTH